MDAQQELFTQLLLGIKAACQGTKVYDGFLPPAGTPYPFIYLADSWQNDTRTKSHIIGTVNQTIHVWSDAPHRRGDVSELLCKIKRVCYRLQSTPNFGWFVSNVDQRILSDNTTSVPLLHGVLEVEFRFS